MYAYTEWLKDFLTDENINRFVKLLKSSFEVYRDEFRNDSVDCHGRIPEIVSCLKIGMKLFLMFLTDYQVVKKEYAEAIENQYEIMLNEIASHQSDNIESERPTSVFVKKIYSLIESGAVAVMKTNSETEFLPSNFVGCEDDDYLYLNKETAHRAVKKLCDEQGEIFNISSKALVKQLAEEGLIKTLPSGNTVSLRFAGKNRRYIALKKNLIEFILNGE